MKLAKLSLAAIMAAGAFTYASATPLENAIKGVDISGYVRYRYYNEDNGATAQNTDRHRFTVPIMFKVPVSDKLTAAVAMFAQKNDWATNSSPKAAAAYSDSTFNLSRMWFNYADAGWNVTLGRQLLKTPYTEGGITGSYGDGLVVMYSPMKNLTLAAASFVKSNQTVDGAVGGLALNNQNINAVAAIGSFSGVNLQLWGFTVDGVVDSAYFFQASGSVAGLSLKGQYSAVSLSNSAYTALNAAGVVNGDDSGSFYGLQAAYKLDNFKVGAGFTSTSSDNGISVLDADGGLIKAGKQLYYVTTNARDTDVYFVTAGAGFGAYSVGAGYVGASSVSGTNLDSSDEFYVQGSYKYNKHMKLSAYYSVLDMSNLVGQTDAAAGDNNEFRFEAKYSF
jgi:hypothetical protein